MKGSQGLSGTQATGWWARPSSWDMDVVGLSPPLSGPPYLELPTASLGFLGSMAHSYLTQERPLQPRWLLLVQWLPGLAACLWLGARALL